MFGLNEVRMLILLCLGVILICLSGCSGTGGTGYQLMIGIQPINETVRTEKLVQKQEKK